MASLEGDSWQSAILATQKANQDTGTCSVPDMSDLPTGRQPVGCKLAFKVKYNADGAVERYRARIVANCYSEIEDHNCDGTVATVTRYNCLHLICVLATHLSLYTDQLDIKSVSVNGDLVEEIWMVPPPVIGLDRKILPLDKALHGLKHAPLGCFEKLSQSLAQVSHMYLPWNPYVHISVDQRLIVVVYLKDFTTAASRSDINRLIDHLRSTFKVTAKARLKYILKIEINHTPEGMELSQHQHITNIL